MEETRDFKGVWIPKNIWLDNRLSATEKIILAEIDSLDIDGQGCYASNQYLAEFCQCSERKVTEAISKLTQLKYISVKSFDGRTRVLQISVESFARQSSRNCEADENKMPLNKIVNNKVNNNDVKKLTKRSEFIDNIVRSGFITDDEIQPYNDLLNTLADAYGHESVGACVNRFINQLQRLDVGKINNRFNYFRAVLMAIVKDFKPVEIHSDLEEPQSQDDSNWEEDWDRVMKELGY